MTPEEQIQERLKQLDTHVLKKANDVLAEALEADKNTENPVDKLKYVMQFADYVICKVYGLTSPAFRKIHSGLFKNKDARYGTALYIWCYKRITDNSDQIIADKLK